MLACLAYARDGVGSERVFPTPRESISRRRLFPKAGRRDYADHGRRCRPWVPASAPGIFGPQVLAGRSKRVLLTFDRDDGELARSSAMAAFRRHPVSWAMPRPPDAGRALAELILSRGDWRGRSALSKPGRCPEFGRRHVRQFLNDRGTTKWKPATANGAILNEGDSVAIIRT